MRNKLVGTLSTFTKEYTVEYEYKLTGPFTNGWYPAFLITIGNYPMYGGRIASAFFYYSGMQVCVCKSLLQ